MTVAALEALAAAYAGPDVFADMAEAYERGQTQRRERQSLYAPGLGQRDEQSPPGDSARGVAVSPESAYRLWPWRRARIRHG
jgi:hypothetical protein